MHCAVLSSTDPRHAAAAAAVRSTPKQPKHEMFNIRVDRSRVRSDMSDFLGSVTLSKHAPASTIYLCAFVL